ncbi:hypothetical protein MOJ79_00110 [Calidifontimicrobium sp. SYSU G02091]|uniref:hypothetical protein n=1 Tax=Calidifontimicrobium sp. SYSU G02091 TaxID=2926421 RepID=UPI001F53BA25|nr:hypothetical protein [Calidifontimicrobium sp. SYSU G02091]MCI1190243.1 hypothetical protein [Calidifontimicrobium sp. SYSU G02091]
MKGLPHWIVALALAGASGVALAGMGCDDKMADGLHDEVPPPKAAKATTPARDARASTATAATTRAPARADAKVVQATK